MRRRGLVASLAILVLACAGESGGRSRGAATAATGASLRPASCEASGVQGQCYWATVPEDRTGASTRALDLWVVVTPARGGSSAEPVVFFPGGPGQATTDLIGFSQRLYEKTLERRDAVYIGQRGTGRSHSIDCEPPADQGPERYFGRLFDLEQVAQCHAAALERSTPGLYNTPRYVEDVADVLDALGYERVVLWGGSGGTRTAQGFLRAHPERVAAVALLGTAPLDLTMPLPFSRFVDRAWQRVVDDCSAQTNCAAAFPDLQQDLETIRRRLEAGPVPTQVRGPGATVTVDLTSGDFGYALRGMLYSSARITRLPAAVAHAARTGDLSVFANAHYQRSAALLGGHGLSLGVHLSAYCSEDIPFIREERVREETGGTLLGRYLVEQYAAACEGWPVDPVPATWRNTVQSDVPVLLVSGYFDPSTPDLAADSVRKGLPNSHHLVVRDAGHDAGSGCAAQVIDHFLAEASLEDLPAPCPSEPPRFETAR